MQNGFVKHAVLLNTRSDSCLIREAPVICADDPNVCF